MADKIIIFSGKQYSGKDTAAKIMLKHMPDYRRCAMGDIIKLTYGKKNNLTYEEIEKNKPLYRQDLIDLGNWGRAQDPDYWLKKIEHNRIRDRENDKKLIFLGYTVIHFWGQDIKKHTDECLQVIEEAIWDSKMESINDDIYDL